MFCPFSVSLSTQVLCFPWSPKGTEKWGARFPACSELWESSSCHSFCCMGSRTTSSSCGYWPAACHNETHPGNPLIGGKAASCTHPPLSCLRPQTWNPYFLREEELASLCRVTAVCGSIQPHFKLQRVLLCCVQVRVPCGF